MATNAKFKFDGTQYDFEKDAGVVKYGGGTLKTVLDNLKPVRMTGFGKQLLSADAGDFRRLLEIDADYFVDECANRWEGFPIKDSSKVKSGFGNYSLRINGNTLRSAPLAFGGDKFTISFWAYLNTSPAVNSLHWLFRAIGGAASFGLDYWREARYTSSNQHDLIDLCKGSKSSISGPAITDTTYDTLQVATGAWKHFEITYDGSKLRYFYNGALKHTYTLEIPFEWRRIGFGSASIPKTYIDSVRVLDGVCAHTAAFTIPTTPYALSDYPDNTIALLNFE